MANLGCQLDTTIIKRRPQFGELLSSDRPADISWLLSHCGQEVSCLSKGKKTAESEPGSKPGSSIPRWPLPWTPSYPGSPGGWKAKMSVLLSNCFRPQCLFITATETKVEQAGETNLNFEKNSWLPKDHMWFCNSEVLGFLSFEIMWPRLVLDLICPVSISKCWVPGMHSLPQTAWELLEMQRWAHLHQASALPAEPPLAQQ